jgi:hypothetical protein
MSIQQNLILNLNTNYNNYNILVNKYDSLYNTYLSNLNEYTNTKVEKFVTLPNSQIIGTKPTNNYVTDVSSCQSFIQNCNNCFGGTYLSNESSCLVYNVDNVTSINEYTGGTVIVPILKYNLFQLELLNTELITITNNINNLLKEIDPELLKENEVNQKFTEKMNKNIERLNKEKDSHNKISVNLSSLNADLNDNEMSVKKQNTLYNYWFLFLVLLILITILIFRFKTYIPTNMIKLMVAFTIIFILSFNLTNVQGYLLWSIVILLIFLKITKIINF